MHYCSNEGINYANYNVDQYIVFCNYVDLFPLQDRPTYATVFNPIMYTENNWMASGSNKFRNNSATAHQTSTVLI